MANPKAQAAKDNGNVAFKSGDYPTAIGHYTTAILADKNDVTYPLNRAAAYLKLGKNEDAERDCTRVLELSPDNVKALFRRSQARTGTGNLAEAHKDLLKVLQIESSNQSAQEELKKVTSLIEKEKSKKSGKGPVSPMQASLDSSTTNKRRRVPIKIIEAPSAAPSTTSSAIPVPSSSRPQESGGLESPSRVVPSTSSKSKPDTLEPVSSRSLKLPVTDAILGNSKASSSTEKGPSQIETPTFTNSYVPSPPTPTLPLPANSNGASKPNSFKDAKRAREAVKPSRVGGGIFRASGSNTIFPPRDNGDFTVADSVNSESSTSPQATGPPVKEDSKMSYMPVPKAPNTLFDFMKSWGSSRSAEEKWQLINTIFPTHFPTLCKTSLEPSMLVSIMETFLCILNTTKSDSRVKTIVREYMENFTRIPRFNTLVLLLSKSEKTLAKNIWMAVGVDQPTGMWSGVV